MHYMGPAMDNVRDNVKLTLGSLLGQGGDGVCGNDAEMGVGNSSNVVTDGSLLVSTVSPEKPDAWVGECHEDSLRVGVHETQTSLSSPNVQLVGSKGHSGLPSRIRAKLPPAFA